MRRLINEQFEAWMADIINTEVENYKELKLNICNCKTLDNTTRSDINFQLIELIELIEAGFLYAPTLIAPGIFESVI